MLTWIAGVRQEGFTDLFGGRDVAEALRENVADHDPGSVWLSLRPDNSYICQYLATHC